jgi:CBS domain-containing protein
MHEAGIGCLPVVNDRGRLVGLVVESDLLRSVYSRDRSTS